MIRASFFRSIAARFSFAALLSAPLGVAALAGCGPGGVGGHCDYESAGTATFTVAAIAPTEDNVHTPSGEKCSVISFTWTSGVTSQYQVHEPFFAAESCLAAAGIQVGSSVELTLKKETSGTCTPEVWTPVDPVSACHSACH